MLNSLEIKNFRSLESFQVKKLGQVNLIVGKNNSVQGVSQLEN